MSDYVSAKAARRAEDEKARAEHRRYMTIVYCVVAAVVLAIVFVALFGSNLFYNGTTALDIGGSKYTVADFNYNYFSVYNSYYSSVVSSYGTDSSGLAGLMLPSTGTSFREQAYFGSEDQTWADYLEDAAIERMKNVSMLCSEAEKEGYALPQEDIDSVDETIAQTRSTAVSGGYKDLQAYLVIMYGKGMTEKVFRENLLRDALAASYSQHKLDSFTFTADEIAAQYEENAATYDYYKYRLYSFSGAAVTDDEETEEDETMSAEDATAKAKADADAFKAAVTDEQSYIDYAASLRSDDEDYDADEATLNEAQGASITQVVLDWLSDSSRKAGDVDVVKSPDDSSTTYYYVVYFLGRDNNRYNAASGYFALFAGEPSTEDGSEPSEDSIREYREANAQEFLDAYNAAPDPAKNIDLFTEEINDFADVISNSGNITTVGIYDVPDAMVDWLFDPARVEGDTTVIYDEDGGAYALYFSQFDGVYGDLMAEAELRSDTYTEWSDEATEPFNTVDRQWEMGLSKKITALGG